jgi:hypothetical protein
MEAALSRKPENARIFTSIDHHKTPGVARQEFPHNQDPLRSFRVGYQTGMNRRSEQNIAPARRGVPK